MNRIITIFCNFYLWNIFQSFGLREVSFRDNWINLQKQTRLCHSSPPSNNSLGKFDKHAKLPFDDPDNWFIILLANIQIERFYFSCKFSSIPMLIVKKHCFYMNEIYQRVGHMNIEGMLFQTYFPKFVLCCQLNAVDTIPSYST